jgi:DNA (cytosine-5)-methyltransferase 1
MRELSLFTGSGGGLLGSLILGWEAVQFVEHDPYCQRVLAARFPDVPCHSDVRDFHPIPGSCDIVTGGFPCQPFSQAGKRLGEDDPRNMWPHAVRVLRESGAPLGFFENVPGLFSSGYFGTVLGDLAEAGFDAEWCVLGADDVGAPHRRKRLWIMAYSRRSRDEPERIAGIIRGAEGDVEGEGHQRERRRDPTGGEGPWWCDPADMGDATRDGLEGISHDAAGGQSGPVAPSGDWLAEPYVGRVAHGVASRVDRLRALGNGQVPQCMAAAFTYLAREAGILMEEAEE